jgi:uncharacterized protein YbjT (DUF2867 family)
MRRPGTVALFDPKRAVRAALEASGLDHTYVESGWFLELQFTGGSGSVYGYSWSCSWHG